MSEEKKITNLENENNDLNNKEALTEKENTVNEANEGSMDNLTENKKEVKKVKKEEKKINRNFEAIARDLVKVELSHIPENLTTGDEIIVHCKIKEWEKERIQLYQWLIIKSTGSGCYRRITVRKISHWVGVERIFVLSSPNIVKIELKNRFKVRRANIGYIRSLTWKSARLKPRPQKNK